MTHIAPAVQVACDSTSGSRWHTLADRVLAEHELTIAEGLAILEAPANELLDLLAASYRIRYRHFENRVQLYLLVNAKSGMCPEDCAYCSQSKVSGADIQKYRMLSQDELLNGAKLAADRKATTYCIVISGRAPTEGELTTVTQAVPRIKAAHDLKICACLGLLSPENARRLKAAGVDRINHNLNTSEEFYKEICSTHSHQDRMDTLKAAKNAGLELCSGGIVGMGESNDDIVMMAFDLRRVGVHSIPVNFLVPIEGTPVSERWSLTPTACLKVLALFRFANPSCEIRIAGGREVHLKSLQPLALYPANSIFVGDYLTTRGQPPLEDYRMIEDLGFEIAVNYPESASCQSAGDD